MAKLHFWAPQENVTGSKYVVECDGYREWWTAGLFQGLKGTSAANWEPPLKPASHRGCNPTHAHIDHTGYLPRLVRDGFRGTVYCTKATADLLTIMLPDSARLQEEEAEYANRKGFGPASAGLYFTPRRMPAQH